MNFDPRYVPFSRYGSYMVLSHLAKSENRTEEKRREEKVYTYEVPMATRFSSGKSFGSSYFIKRCRFLLERLQYLLYCGFRPKRAMLKFAFPSPNYFASKACGLVFACPTMC